MDKSDVWDQFGYWIFSFYTDARPVIENEEKDDPAAWSNVPLLVNDLTTIDAAQNRGSRSHPSLSDIYDFYLSEAEAPLGAPIPVKSRIRGH